MIVYVGCDRPLDVDPSDSFNDVVDVMIFVVVDVVIDAFE